MSTVFSAILIVVCVALGAVVGYWLANRGRATDTRRELDAARRRDLAEVYARLQELHWSLQALLSPNRRDLLDDLEREGTASDDEDPVSVPAATVDPATVTRALRDADLAFRRKRFLLPIDTADALSSALSTSWDAVAASADGNAASAAQSGADEGLDRAMRGIESELRQAMRVSSQPAELPATDERAELDELTEIARSMGLTPDLARSALRTRDGGPRVQGQPPRALPGSGRSGGGGRAGGTTTFGPRATGRPGGSTPFGPNVGGTTTFGPRDPEAGSGSKSTKSKRPPTLISLD